MDIYNGNLETAREALNKALVTFRNVGDSIGIIQVLHNRTRIDLLRSNFASAKKLLAEALELSWRMKSYGITCLPHDQKIYESTRDQLRKDLSANKFAQYWQQGCETSEAEIVKKYIKTAARAAV